jgi:hypothetical protein
MEKMICPVNHTHLVVPVCISPALSYWFCKECKKEVGGKSQKPRGVFTLNGTKEPYEIPLFDSYPFTSILIGKRKSGKTEVIKSLLQHCIDEGERVKMFVFDSNESYGDWVRLNRGMLINSHPMLKSILRNTKLLSDHQIFCFSGKAFDAVEDMEKLINELNTLFLESKVSTIKKVVVMDAYNDLLNPHAKLEKFVNDCLNFSVSQNISVLISASAMPNDSICQTVNHLLVFEQNSYPTELRTFFSLDPRILPPISALGFFGDMWGKKIDYARFIHVAAPYSQHYQYFNVLRHSI